MSSVMLWGGAGKLCKMRVAICHIFAGMTPANYGPPGRHLHVERYSYRATTHLSTHHKDSE